MHEHSAYHEGAMVDVYSKMKPDSFKSQLHSVLTAFYEDINWVQGSSCCPKTSTRSSSASSRTNLKRRPEQRLTRTPPPTPLPTLPPPPPRRTGARQTPPARWILQRSPSLQVALHLALGARASG